MVLSGQDPRRADKVTRYKPPKEKAAGEDPIPEYMNLLAMLFSICGLMMKMKWAAWAAVYCSFISYANSRGMDDAKQLFSSFMLAASAVIMSYLQNPGPMQMPW
ncbi:PAT complex subunit Asterix-like [Corticium candelabrum]|uniref:PAT complex subunit Asterix-like n=1 Tax=Corticium candelabrum TaxID=121492 RepID=UPI002E253AF4|nr:PAT complex subunit Asterix-like [Corticium candelabrum]